MNENFYRDLKAYDNFSNVFESHQYTDLPNDWLIIVSDVLGSTKAIEEGKYKEVNTIGASTIICILNATGHQSLCYQFWWRRCLDCYTSTIFTRNRKGSELS